MYSSIEIYKHFLSASEGYNDEWGWRLKATNGEEIASGGGHGSPRDAERAVKTVVRTALSIAAEVLADNWSAVIVHKP